MHITHIQQEIYGLYFLALSLWEFKMLPKIKGQSEGFKLSIIRMMHPTLAFEKRCGIKF